MKGSENFLNDVLENEPSQRGRPLTSNERVERRRGVTDNRYKMRCSNGLWPFRLRTPETRRFAKMHSYLIFGLVFLGVQFIISTYGLVRNFQFEFFEIRRNFPILVPKSRHEYGVEMSDYVRFMRSGLLLFLFGYLRWDELWKFDGKLALSRDRMWGTWYHVTLFLGTGSTAEVSMRQANRCVRCGGDLL